MNLSIKDCSDAIDGVPYFEFYKNYTRVLHKARLCPKCRSGYMGNNSVKEVRRIAVGNILCTDNTIVPVSAWPVMGKEPRGVVFHVFDCGHHGWAVALTESDYIAWTKQGKEKEVVGLENCTDKETAYDDIDGYANTHKIRAAGNATTYPAAYAVDFDNGWYLPACGQMVLLIGDTNKCTWRIGNIEKFNRSERVNNTLSILNKDWTDASVLIPKTRAENIKGTEFLSSTQYNQFEVWFMKNNDCKVIEKSRISTVRAIRDFSVCDEEILDPGNLTPPPPPKARVFYPSDDFILTHRIVLPDSVTEIGAYAFDGRKVLETVQISPNVWSIQKGAFRGCTALTEIVLPDSVTEIGAYAFEGCTSLKSIQMSSNVQSIQECAFKDCLSLKSLDIPNKLKEIGERAFNGCTNLVELLVPKGVDSIGKKAFFGCVNLESFRISLKEQSLSMMKHVFRGCPKLKSVTLLDGSEETEWLIIRKWTRNGERIVGLKRLK